MFKDMLVNDRLHTGLQAQARAHLFAFQETALQTAAPCCGILEGLWETGVGADLPVS